MASAILSTSQIQRQLYFPPCNNPKCKQWFIKISELLKDDISCAIRHPINDSYANNFSRYFDQSRFVVIHYCQALWEKIGKFQEKMYKNQYKIITIRFDNVGLEDESLTEENLDLDRLFSTFDSEQDISDNTEVLQSFKEDLLSCFEQNQSNYTESEFVSNQPLICYTQQTSQEIQENPTEEEEDDDEDVLKFDKYPDFGYNRNHLYVKRIICDFGDQTVLDNFQVLEKKLKKLEDGYSSTDDFSTVGYILHSILPDKFKTNDLASLTSIGTSQITYLNERALDLLELSLLQYQDAFSDKDLSTLFKVESILIECLLKHQSDSLRLLERICNCYLLVIGTFINQSHDNSPKRTQCLSLLNTRSKSVSSFKSTNENLQNYFDVLRKTIDEAVKMKKALKTRQDIQFIGAFFRKLMNKNDTHLLLVYFLRLLKKVYSLDHDALQDLKIVIKETVNVMIFGFIHFIVHSLTLFLTLKTCEMTDKNISEFCKEVVEVIDIVVEEPDDFLQRLLFNSNETIRTKMIDIFKANDSYGELQVMKYIQREIEYEMSPLLHQLKVKDKEIISWTIKDWKLASGKLVNEDVWLHMYNSNPLNSESLRENKNYHYTEMKRLTCLQHKNIITMFAYQEESTLMYYLTENCDHNLQMTLTNKRKNNDFYRPSLLLQFLVEAVSALKHCHNKGYAHCNLTAECLIVVKENHVKLGGFGLCKRLEPSKGKALEVNSEDIPLRWSAPESILDGVYSKETDIWMIGHVIWEVMTHGVLPYSYMDTADDELIELMKTKKLQQPIIEPVVEREAILKIVLNCISYDESSRTNVADVEASLKNVLSKVNRSGRKKFDYPTIDKLYDLSTNCSRGVPKQFHKTTAFMDFYNISHTVSVDINLDRTRDKDMYIFREKIHRNMTTLTETTSKVLDDILPQKREIVQRSKEMKHFECVIPNENCSPINNAVREVKGLFELVNLLYLVAEKLLSLSNHSFAIGYLSGSRIYVQLEDIPKIHLISLAHLTFLKDNEYIPSEELKSNLSDYLYKRTAPEVLESGRFSSASDVYCFGNLMWELLTAFSLDKNSHPVINNIHIFRRLQPKDVKKAVMSGEWESHHKKPSRCTDSLYDIIKSCVEPIESKRLTLTQLVSKLKSYVAPVVVKANTSVEDAGLKVSVVVNQQKTSKPSDCDSDV